MLHKNLAFRIAVGIAAATMSLACSGSVLDDGLTPGDGGGTGGDAGSDANLPETSPPPDTSAPPDATQPPDGAPPPDAVPPDGTPPPDTAPPDGACSDPEADFDGDGYTINQGDCNDCDPNVNPGAFDRVGGGVDEDCDGTVDNEPAQCDQSLDIASVDAMHGARAIGLCRTVDPNATGKNKTWGVLATRYVKVDGSPGMNPSSHGLLPGFGVVVPYEGATILALSSGTARAPNQPGYQAPSGADMGTTGMPPAGYPKESPACPGVITGNCYDPAALQIEIRVPTNAHAFSFKFNFYTYEFPEYICSAYNDFFVTMMNPTPAGLSDGNISFDPDENPISVNSSLLQVCEPQTAGGKTYPCPLGPDLLSGTGFDQDGTTKHHAATGWLQTTAPVAPGSVITLRFAIWDSGDAILDSTVLVDDFQWSVQPVSKVETVPVSAP